MSMNPGYHGCSNAKYKSGKPDAVVTPIGYVKNISLDPQINKTPQHANNRMVLNVYSDNGYTGNLGVTAKDPELEKAIGRAVELSGGGFGIVGGAGSVRLDGLYYEYLEEREKLPSIVKKVWLLNVELSPASENASTDTDSVAFGEYTYPITVYGETVKAGQDEDYVDENGHKLTCYMVISSPSDANYATFGNAVPVPAITEAGGE